MPRLERAATLRLFATQDWSAVQELFALYPGSSPQVTPSSYKGLQNPDLLPLIDRYYRGSDASAEERIKLCKQMEGGLGRPGARWPGTGLAMARFEWSGYPWQ